MCVGDLAHHPLGQDEVVGGLLDGHGLELDLVLHELSVGLEDVADLAMDVLQRNAHRSEVSEHLLADLLALREGRRLLVAALLLDGIDPLRLVDEVVLQLAEGLEGQPGLFGQRDGCTSDDLLARVGQRFAVLVVEGAQDVERGPLAEGVEKGVRWRGTM